MSVQSWMVKSWPVVEWYLPPVADVWPKLWHGNTAMGRRSDCGDRLHGDSVWLGVINGRSVGVAWEWIELRAGVFMLTDPNSILSNIRFLTQDGAEQEHLASLVSLNRLVHHLPWQPAVCAVAPAPQAHRNASAPALSFQPTPNIRAIRGAVAASRAA